MVSMKTKELKHKKKEMKKKKKKSINSMVDSLQMLSKQHKMKKTTVFMNCVFTVRKAQVGILAQPFGRVLNLVSSFLFNRYL